MITSEQNPWSPRTRRHSRRATPIGDPITGGAAYVNQTEVPRAFRTGIQ